MDSSMKVTKKHCFVEEDDGLASIVDMEAGFSGNHHYPLVSRPLYYNHPLQRSSLRNVSSAFVSSPRSARIFNEPHQPHFLDACSLCKKPLGGNSDIFMYRGDTPFCSEDCRQEQIETDEAKEKNCNPMRTSRKDQRKSTTSNKTSQGCTFRKSTVAAA